MRFIAAEVELDDDDIVGCELVDVIGGGGYKIELVWCQAHTSWIRPYVLYIHRGLQDYIAN
jgi:hypothetical protein